ncbi:hypothetical protein ACFE04_023957 [Oxalis oulophora]
MSSESSSSSSFTNNVTSSSSTSSLSQEEDPAGDFECNICFEIAHDPIVTLCGHLFCWPCLYRWLHHHSHSQECPVCKAIVQQDNLVPLYGRGAKNQTDPRTKSYPGIDIPTRPAGQRPATAQPRAATDANYGFLPTPTARIGNFTMGFGGLFPSLFNIQFHGFTDATVYGTTSGVPYGFGGFHARGIPQPARQRQQSDNVKNLLLLMGVLVIFFLLFW